MGTRNLQVQRWHWVISSSLDVQWEATPLEGGHDPPLSLAENITYVALRFIRV